MKGYTIIEAIVSVSVMLVLISIVVPSYTSIRRGIALDSEAIELTQNVRQVQEMSMSVKEGPGGSAPRGGYGVYFDINNPNQYIVFADIDREGDYDGGEYVKTITFGNKAEIDRFLGAVNNFSVVYQPPEPVVVIKSDGADHLGVEISLFLEIGNKSRRILFNKSGLIYVR